MHVHTEALITELQAVALRIRLDSLDMVYRRKAGHLGGSFSAAEILAALYFHHMRIDPSQPKWPARDRFILSKGHAAAGLYAALAERGYFPKEELATWGQLGGHLQGHPDRLKTVGVDMTSGLLGHGLSLGVGMALGQRVLGPRHHTYVLLGDADIQSGLTWEGALVAAKYCTSELTAIVDYNNVTNDGYASTILPFEPLIDKWRAFGFATLEINGHDLRQVLDTLDTALEIHNRPTVIIAHTTKGKGVSFMQNTSEWHGKIPTADQYVRAQAELSGA